MAVGRGRAHLQGGQGQGGGRRQVLRLFRLRPAHQGHALAPRAGACCAGATRASSTSISTWRTTRASRIRRTRKIMVRLRHRRAGPPGRRLAGGDGAAGVEGEARALAAVGPADAAQGAGRCRGDLGVLARTCKDLLLAAPAGPRATMGLDPGIRTGVKVAVVDATGKVRRDGDDLSARAEERLAGLARHAGRAVPAATRSSWSASATARRAARPTSWSPS